MWAELALAAVLATAPQGPTIPPTAGPAAEGSPAWHLQPSSADPGGRTIVDATGTVSVHPPIPGAIGTNATIGVPPCRLSTVCQHRGGPSRLTLKRVTWDQTLGYRIAYPFRLPPGDGGVAAVGLDRRGNLWALQRRASPEPQLYQFDPAYRLIRQIGEDIIGHLSKGHCLAIDGDDNVWICDQNGAVVMQISPDGRLLKTIGEKNHRGDWDEAKSQHLLWQPTVIAIGLNGDIYIGQGHGNESPNDVDSSDPTNVLGAARVLHLDRQGRFLGQWLGDETGPGKFDQIHALAVDPLTGDIWIGDREQYRIVIYNADGVFLRTILTRNLSNNLRFDAKGNPWMATGQDGQVLKLDRNGKVVGAIGNGMGIGHGQFIETSVFALDAADNIYLGDTSVGRITKLIAPRQVSRRVRRSKPR